MDAAADRRHLREVADQLESFKVVEHHFSVVIVSFNGVGEQSAVVPGGVAAAAIGEAFT